MSPLDTAQKDDTAATMIVSLSGSCCRIVVIDWPFPLWAVMAAIGAVTLRLRRGGSWHRGPAAVPVGPGSAG